MSQQIDYENTIRDMIRHENDLMNHRIMWLLTLEGLLFTALGFAWDKSDTRLLIYVLCFIGFAVPVSTATVLHGAFMALRRLRSWWDEYAKKLEIAYNGPGVTGYLHEQPWVAFFTPWMTFPTFFASAWIAVAVINFNRSTSLAQIPLVLSTSEQPTLPTPQKTQGLQNSGDSSMN